MIGIDGGSQLSRLFREPPVALSGCALADLGSSCALRESSAGYESALAAAGMAFKRTSLHSLLPSRLVILPAAVFTHESELVRVRRHLKNGSTVILESGAAFINAEGFYFHRCLMDSVLGLSLHAPIRLWESADSFSQSPYIDYRWPVVTKVREFSRIIPVDCRSGETIAWFHKLPVAIKRRVGKGTLVFLGSPLGPHLLAGDREAGNWLQAVCASC